VYKTVRVTETFQH